MAFSMTALVFASISGSLLRFLFAFFTNICAAEAPDFSHGEEAVLLLSNC